MARLITIFTLLAVLGLGVGTAQAARIYSAVLSPDQVLPESGASAYGEATLVVDDTGTMIHLTLNFAGLDTPQSGAELLYASEGEVGTVAHLLPLGTPLATTLDNTVLLNDALEAESLSIQVASEDWPGGAIRGTFAFVTVGTEASSWTAVKNIFE